MTDARRPTIGIGVVVLRGAPLEVLLIQRGKPPRAGQWSIPGGKQEWGETVQEGACREVLEETGLVVDIMGLVDVVDLYRAGSPKPGSSGSEPSMHYTLIDFVARPIGGRLQAGSDAAAARWVPIDALAPYALWDETERVIRKAVRFLP